MVEVFVFRANENDRGGKSGFDVPIGEDLFGLVRPLPGIHLELFHERDQIEHGVEEDQSIGPGGYGEVVGFRMQVHGGPGTCGKESAGGSPGGDDAAGVDAKTFGVATHPSHGADCVFDAGVNLDFVDDTAAIFGADSYHSRAGAGLGLGLELFCSATAPGAAGEEDDGGARGSGGMIPGVVDIDHESALADGLVNILGGQFWGFRVSNVGGGQHDECSGEQNGGAGAEDHDSASYVFATLP